jgi:hypothetical protein
MKNTWFRPYVRFQPMVAEWNGDSQESSTQPQPVKRKLLVRYALFRGDPREFLG